MNISIQIDADVYLGYDVPIFYQLNVNNQLVVNPQFFIIPGARSQLKISLFNLIEWDLLLKFVGYKATFIDASYVQDLDDFSNLCYGLDWSTKGFFVEAEISLNVKECTFGIMGLQTNDFYDCQWVNYIPSMPAYT